MITSPPPVPPAIAGHIVAAANRHAIPVHLLAAIAAKESSFYAGAVRSEPLYAYVWDVLRGEPFRGLTDEERARSKPPAGFRGPTGASAATEWSGQRTSWGLCLAEGTPVATADGWRPVEGVAAGARVLDRHGRLSEVVATASRTADCLTVRVGLNAPLELTPNHPVFARKSTLAKHGTGRRKVVTAEVPEWIEASELREWDMLAFPRANDVSDVESLRLFDVLDREPRWKDGSEYVEDGADLVLRYRSGGRERARVRNEVIVGEELLELVGLYEAEGNRLEKEKGLAFSFHEKETHLHARVLALFRSVFGADPSYSIRRNPANHSAQVCVYGPAARWLGKLLPGTARDKVLPGWMLWLPPQKQAALVRGMWLGDGCLGRGHYTTASESLAYSMVHLLGRLGIVARLTPCRTWFNVGLNSHDAVERFREMTGLPVVWPQTANGRERHTAVSWRCDADFLYFPVRSVEAAGERRVFDLQVPSDSSFVAGRTVVHNCQVMGANAREHGFRGVFFTDLCEPEIGLEFGCRFLAKLLSRNSVEDAVSAYNWGHPSTQNFETYVQPVMRWAAGYKVAGI